MVRPDVAPSDSQLKPDPIAPITSLTATRDAASVCAAIRERYGFEPSLRYCMELIDFVEALTDGQQRA